MRKLTDKVRAYLDSIGVIPDEPREMTRDEIDCAAWSNLAIDRPEMKHEDSPCRRLRASVADSPTSSASAAQD